MAAARLCLASMQRLVRTSSQMSQQTPWTDFFGATSTWRHFATTPFCTDRKYSDKHEWVSVDGAVGTVGVSNYAQEALGDIVYAQLPDIDAELEADEECGALESVKAASELFTPVSGTVREVNEALADNPALINSGPYDDGWLFKLKLANADELNQLMDEEAYAAFLQEEH